MVASLQSQLQQLAATFAESVLAAIHAASLEELIGEPRTSRAGTSPGLRKSGPAVAKRMSSQKSTRRLARRTPEQIAGTVDRVVALVKKHKDGLRAEQIAWTLAS